MHAGWVGVGAALSLPWVVAILWLRLLFPTPMPGRWPLLLGYGYVLGLLVTTLILRLQAALFSALSLDAALQWWPSIVVFGCLILGVLKFQRSGWTVTNSAPRRPPLSVQPAWWQRLLIALLLVLLSIRLLGLALEVWWLPLYPWDAWTTWAVRAQIWAHSQTLVPFVGPETWLAEPSGQSHSILAWRYPPAVSLIAAWPALAFGDWNETVANLPWIGCALALALGLYGQARLWGVSPLTGLLFVWLLLSLPMLGTHVALAGYADLWLATSLGLSFFALMHWTQRGDWRQVLLAILLALGCALIKREGLVWMLLLLAIIPAARLGRGWLLLTPTTAIAAALAIWLAGGIQLSLPMLGQIVLGPDRLQLPGIGTFELQSNGSWEPVIRYLFINNNWHLLPLLVPIAWVAATILLARDMGGPALRAGLLWTTMALFAVYLLFFWTSASQWAERGSSINRILLHLAPALMFWVLTIWYTATADRENGNQPADA